MIQTIKEQVTLSMAAKHFNIELLPNKAGQHCPACNGSSSLKTRDDRFFKCYKCNASGSVIDFAMTYGKVSSVSEAIAMLRPLAKDLQAKPGVSSLRTKVYNIYKENLQRNSRAAQYYMKSRGWDYTKVDCGLATANCLQEAGLSNITLQQIDLWDGYDYYNNHLIFPVYNEYGTLVHFSGRAIGDSDIRWKSSKGTPPINNYFYNSQSLYQPKSNYLIVCEGVSDCISMMQMEESVIGQFGISVDLYKHAEHFSKFDFIIFMYDYDQYPLGSQFAGTYKSWSQMMPKVIELAMLIRKPIYHLPLPGLSGIKDINDWLLYIDYDKDIYSQYRNKNTEPITTLALDMYKGDKSKQFMIWKLMAAIGDKWLAKQIVEQQSDIVDYLLEVFGYE